MSQRSGSRRWFAWGFAWSALMIAILIIGDKEWPNSDVTFAVALFGSILGNGLITFRRRHGYWPWTPAARRLERISL